MEKNRKERNIINIIVNFILIGVLIVWFIWNLYKIKNQGLTSKSELRKSKIIVDNIAVVVVFISFLIKILLNYFIKKDVKKDLEDIDVINQKENKDDE